jgi:hypothetical protein
MNRSILRVHPVQVMAVCLALSASSLAESRLSLTIECEVAVALSAAPQRLRASASVYALTEGEYKKVVTGDGPLTCVIERNHDDSVIPQCMDKAGIDSVLPAILSRSRMAVAGASFEAINASNRQRIEAGEFEPAARAGMSYMMSDYNYAFVESSGRVMKLPPHVMFYAPYVKNSDVGGSFQSLTENIGTTFVLNEGVHGYMIVYTEHEADPNEVAEKCTGQLGEPPPTFNPFPKG